MFFFNDTATTEIYTLSLHDALPILRQPAHLPDHRLLQCLVGLHPQAATSRINIRHGRGQGYIVGIRIIECLRSEEHTSELQSRQYLVCRLLLEKKKNLTASNSPYAP